MGNSLWTGDNLYILNGMNSASVDLIYLDPPFNSKRTYSASLGSKAAGASFKDMWTWQDVDESCLDALVETYPALVRFIETIGDIGGRPMMAYITYMAQRIIELHRILKETGCLYLHVDPTASHYLKVVLDEIFGKDNFLNEVIWSYRTGGASSKKFAQKHDVILFYAKTSGYYFGDVKEKSYTRAIGRKAGVVNYGAGSAEFFQDTDGVYNLVNCRDVWDIPYINSQAKERTGYPTQKPLALLERIIRASSKKGDVVLDPFCGCATTCVAAQQLGRRWIGIDIEEKAVDILMERLSGDLGFVKDFTYPTDFPQRTDIKIESPKSESIKERLFTEQAGNCNGCGVTFEARNLEVDHIFPKSKGGGDYYENFQLLCGSCNRIKGSRPMEYLRVRIKRINETRERITFGG